ncbi:glycosyltransferase 87 family protein [Actinokineospora bangkokensis]|uniref:Glycosyltransferase RgtA/B/C/D-like domain-containing protein n=1 Tax=Actinokineospora bangkokensis TaxID=1193682 RepID=A0A1Q9LCC4_9PSEU|nr:glycosyltransferase 87 family protein [Actinokineospora bangkokensis]OLR89681.1 hypothetical protein BJP25_01185 [Actinokineospora bangkokensis]
MSATDVTSSAADSDPGPPTPPDPVAPPRSPVWSRVSHLVLPAVVYLGVRQVGLLFLAWLADREGSRVSDALRSWDGEWFLAIARGGYGGVPANLVDAYGRHNAETALAFFPGYPAVVGLFTAAGLPAVASALAVSVVSGVACAYALARLGERVRGGSRRAGLVLVALFAGSPMAVSLSMTYSEALFCALAAWSLVFTLERRWVPAGLLCAVAGLVRTTGAALVLAVGLAALVAVLARRDGWRPWLGGVLAPLGLLGYLGWVATRTGSLTGWFDLQERGWDSHFDWGRATVAFAADRLADGRSVMEVGTVAVVVLALVLVGVAVRSGLEWPLLVYGVAVLVMDVGANGMMASKARLLVPAFTLLVPVALALARRRASTALLVLAGFTLVGSWFGAYALTAWGYAI